MTIFGLVIFVLSAWMLSRSVDNVAAALRMSNRLKVSEMRSAGIKIPGDIYKLDDLPAQNSDKE